MENVDSDDDMSSPTKSFDTTSIVKNMHKLT